MKPLLLALPLLFLLAPVPAHADEPLLCVDVGAVEVEDVTTIDPPMVCVL